MIPASDIATEPKRTKTFDVAAVRSDFPILAQRVKGKRLVYLDNAATTQKPTLVIDGVRKYYQEENSNIHRGIHYLSEKATELYEAARRKAQRFLNASDSREIVFVRGTTEGINLVAQSFVRQVLEPGDEVLISAMEHHSNIVPWQMVCGEKHARLRVIPINDRGEIDLDAYEHLLSDRTKLIALAHVSNALGTVNPVKQMISMAKKRDIPVLLDGAQAVSHKSVDVQDLGCDFYAFSSHKVFGPTGSGVLFGRGEILERMPPYQGGGEMIRSVTFEQTTYNELPFKFEAGTPNIAGNIGLGIALDYLGQIDRPGLEEYEASLLAYGTRQLSAIDGVRIIGTAGEKVPVFSFVIEGVHAHDVGTILDDQGIAVRTGHHCAQPVMDRFSVPATVRASLAFYNTHEEIDALVRGIEKVREVFR